jgi:nucleoside phosphorylase
MRSEKHPKRLQPSATEAKTAETSFQPVIKNTPDLPAIDWSKIGAQAPTLLDTPADELPEADAIVITWAGAEWAALEHVFCSSSSPMPYSDRSQSSWDGWQKYDQDMPAYSGGSGEQWSYWGYYRLVQIQESKVLLFKSNTHLDWPGEQYLEDLINRLIDDVKPRLLLSIGTAGGARTTDHVGTVNVVRAGVLYETDEPSSQWPVYSNDWEADWATINQKNFKSLLFPVPTKKSDLQSLCEQFNKYYGTSYTLSQLNPGDLNMGNAQPHLNNMTPQGTSLLTTSTFVVATSAGNFNQYACVEMDDAIIAKVCQGRQTPFGFVRNISDPVQNAALPQKVQGNWGSTIYGVYGLYTSYNGALATWAIVNAGHSN